MTADAPEERPKRKRKHVIAKAATRKTVRGNRNTDWARRQAAKSAEVELKRAHALELRVEGWTLAVIAEAIGLSVPRTHELIEEALAARVNPPLEALRTLMLDQLDAMLTGIMPQAKTGDHAAIGSALSILARKAKLQGVDAPVRLDIDAAVNHSGKVDHLHKIEIEFVTPEPKTIDGVVVSQEHPAPDVMAPRDEEKAA